VLNFTSNSENWQTSLKRNRYMLLELQRVWASYLRFLLVGKMGIDMLGEATRDALGKAVQDKVGSYSRQIIFYAIAAVFGSIALIFAVSVLFWWLDDLLGGILAGTIMSAGAVVLAIGFTLLSKSQNTNVADSPSAVAVVQEEAKEAVDYFGAARLMATAFVFGFGAAKRLRR
jgi:hypothetical protein